MENYKRFEVDTIVLVSYIRGSNFSVVKDSIIQITPGVTSDTARATHGHSINADSDWKIKLPSLNKEVKVADFNITTARCGCGNRKYDLVRTFTVNGVLQTNYFFRLPR